MSTKKFYDEYGYPKPHKHCEVIKAWADGHAIQWKDTSNYEWKDLPGSKTPGFLEIYEYRIKPKTIKYRVALYKASSHIAKHLGSNYYYTGTVLPPNSEIVEKSKLFVKWVTDWVEVEIDEA